jgi:hypothetical protein
LSASLVVTKEKDHYRKENNLMFVDEVN